MQALALSRALWISLLALLVLLVLELGVMWLATGYAPNRVQFPFIAQFDLYRTLWAENPLATLQLIFEKPMAYVEHWHGVSFTQVWGLYFNPLTVLVHVLGIVYFGLRLSLEKTTSPKQVLSRFIGLCLVISAVTYIWLASCCGSDPGWLLDVWLLSQVYDPLQTGPFLQDVYHKLEPVFIVFQSVFAVIGMYLLFRPRAKR